jgi:acyl-coenzyme A synthetase/AMP-(fatty) acid ligase
MWSRGQQTLELFLMSRLYPAVKQAAVFGTPHPVMGEVVQAVVTLQAGQDVDGAVSRTIIEHCRRKLSGYKVGSIQLRYLKHPSSSPDSH